MKTIGVILIGIGIILTIVRAVPPEISWIVILVGIIFLLIGYISKKSF